MVHQSLDVPKPVVSMKLLNQRNPMAGVGRVSEAGVA
jgi:hypothetical protein